MMTYIWIAILAVALIVEAFTADFVAIWFVPSALVAMVLSFFQVPAIIQVLVFLILGVVLVIATRRVCRRFIEASQTKTNVDAIIGQEAYVTEEINNLQGLGEVKVGGLAWSARSQNGESIAVDTLVTIVEVQGVKLIVTPKENK